ncbi:MAG: hypothetical protein V5A72_02550 [Candidatus Nanohaloarchaea archaeon]
MDFERYSPEIHENLVPEFFSGVAERPEKFENLKDIVGNAFEDIEDVAGLNAEFNVVLAEVAEDELGSIPEGLYFRGYSLGKEAHGHAEENIVFLAAPREYEYLEAGLKNMAVHEEAHQEFFEYLSDLDHVIWESMILEGHALTRERLVRDEKNYKWRGDPRKYQGSSDEIVEVLDKNREWNGSRYNRDNTSSLFNTESEWEGIGYVIAENVYSDLLDRNNMDVDEPLIKEKEWLREQVEISIKNLYN